MTIFDLAFAVGVCGFLVSLCVGVLLAVELWEDWKR